MSVLEERIDSLGAVAFEEKVGASVCGFLELLHTYLSSNYNLERCCKRRVFVSSCIAPVLSLAGRVQWQS